MSQPTVVNLKNTDKAAVKVPPIVHTVRQHTRRSLDTLLQALFDSTDDALFELADKSGNNTEQALYFEAMRQIRLRREDVCGRFGNNLYCAFDELFGAKAAPEPTLDDDPDNLSLVGNDDLEVTVAIAGIVSKVSGQHSLAIMQLTKRLDYLSKSQSVTERSNPLGPLKLSNAFVEAADCLDLDIRVTIILLKLFERLVMERIDGIYSKANALMTEAGVLPDLKDRKAVPNRPAPAVPISSGQFEETEILDPPLLGQGGPTTFDGTAPLPSFGLMQQLLAGTRPEDGDLAGYAAQPGQGGGAFGAGGSAGAIGSMSGGGAGFAGGSAGSGGSLAAGGAFGNGGFGGGGYSSGHSSDGTAPGNGSVGGGGIAISTPQLVALLSSLQQDTDEQHIDPATPAPLLDLRNMVFSQAEQDLGDDDKHIEQNDEDALNIVGMLFDYILNDRNLAIPMKALISRLQIPFVKLAIIDKSFFDKTSHPARQLLNELSSAGIGWSGASELKRDARYNKIESIVLRVLNGFTDDIGLFEELVEDLRSFLKQEDKRHVQVEQRVQQAETGKAKTHNIKSQVQQLINSKASGLRLPAQVGRFISDHFARSLVMTGVKEGENSGDWHMKLKTLDDLLWSCQPLSEDAELDKRDAMQVDMQQRLRNIIAAIIDDQTAAEELLFNLECELADVAARDRAFLDEDEVEAPPEPGQYAKVTEIRLTEVSSEDTDQLEQAAPEFIEHIRGLNEGNWVELHSEGAPSIRCKLSAIIQPGDRYVFVNRRGMKVADYGRMELARRLEAKELTLLDESQVFDRALQAVVGNLRNMQSKPIAEKAED
ncbi:MAG: DUF1631 domain-containing protein [Pseudomonadales bacterium]